MKDGAKRLGRYAGLVLGGWLLFSGRAHAQISPGKLAQPHAFLDGIQNCVRCHKVGRGPSEEKCLACHQEIQQRLDEKRGFHFTVIEKEKRACFRCHSDHAGRQFKLVYWPEGMDQFDHTRTGYRLQGKHQTVPCRDCHQPDLIREDLRKLQPNINLQRTFLGLSRDCVSCHTDEHRGQLGQSCENCHSPDGWKPASGFDHARARFKLTGSHRQVECQQCHPAVVDRKAGKGRRNTYVKYKGLAFGTCSACHEDVHRGKFGSNCEQCHTTRGWKMVNRRRFDHSRTRFPLKGRHATVDCQQCHTSGNVLKPLAFQQCRDCHADEHRGQFAHREDGGRCEACHTEEGFTPALFTIRDHQETRFALAGAHLAVPCVSCHTLITDSDGHSYRQFRIERRACNDCHDDVHKGQFREQIQKDGCAACHTTESWQAVRFDHDQSRFPLTGLHRQVTCDQCHKPVDVGTPMERILFKPIHTTCETCHQDPHAGQFRERQPVKSCDSCHQTAGWQKLTFDHNRDSRFKLENAHARVDCAGCHKPVRQQGLVFIRYRPIDPKCSTCH